MIDGAEFRAMAMAFPKALEKPHFDRTSFRVDAPRGKIFATAVADFSTANLPLDPMDQQILCDALPDVFAPVPGKWGASGWTTLTLAACDADTLLSALTRAWKRAAPDKLHALLEG